MVALFAIAVWGCYWAQGKAERELVAQEGRPLQLPNWSIKWFALAILAGVASTVYYVVKTV
jgi:hypothetical protein